MSVTPTPFQKEIELAAEFQAAILRVHGNDAGEFNRCLIQMLATSIQVYFKPEFKEEVTALSVKYLRHLLGAQ